MAKRNQIVKTHIVQLGRPRITQKVPMEVAHALHAERLRVAHFALRLVRAVGLELARGREDVQITDGHAQQLKHQRDSFIATHVRHHGREVTARRGATDGHPAQVEIELRCLFISNLHICHVSLLPGNHHPRIMDIFKVVERMDTNPFQSRPAIIHRDREFKFGGQPVIDIKGDTAYFMRQPLAEVLVIF